MHPVHRSPPGRRPTREVRIGGIAIGGKNPIRIQSMLTSDTMDTEACVRETLGLVAAGCEIVRLAAPTVNDARNLGPIRDGLRRAGCTVPLVADIHFKPEAALEAALWVDKVRINPGNFADTKKFAVREYSDAEYEDELRRIRIRFEPLVRLCRERGVAMRIGTNHGSLSDRIMNRFGDSPAGMVESALEFARIARDLDFHDLVFSMKASNPKVMIHAYRLLVSRLEALNEFEMRNVECGMEDSHSLHGRTIPNSKFQIPNSSWLYPIHLGVTEAGDGEDGRIKSAIGIGSLLADGIGDTIRVSLTEDSVREIPVARALVALAESRHSAATTDCGLPDPVADPVLHTRRASQKIPAAGVPTGGGEVVRVAVRRGMCEPATGGDFVPEIVYEDADILEINPLDEAAVADANALPAARLATVSDSCPLDILPAFRLLAARLDPRHPILLKDRMRNAECEMRNAECEMRNDPAEILLAAATNLGALLCDGIGDAVLVEGEGSLRLAYNILQAAGVRIFKTDYVACPSCGRTLFNLQETTARIRAATVHLKGVKIAIMGCIVNGPGEMADADFGYVGGAPGKVNLYVGKSPVKFNIPTEEAVDRLVDLIREHGRWFDPPTPAR
jgi:(E)-4-hydroxy-3-methylbut-2-enyl-diphosphate synthase